MLLESRESESLYLLRSLGVPVRSTDTSVLIKGNTHGSANTATIPTLPLATLIHFLFLTVENKAEKRSLKGARDLQQSSFISMKELMHEPFREQLTDTC